MANQPKQTRENKSVPWSSGLRPKVGSTVTYRSEFWVNLDGSNGIPGLSSSWSKIVDKDNYIEQVFNSGGNYNNVETLGNVLVFNNTNAQAILTGFSNNVYKRLSIINNSDFELRLNAEDFNSSTENQIKLPTGLTSIGVEGSCELSYIQNLQKWQIVDSFASKYRPEHRGLTEPGVEVVLPNAVSETREIIELIVFRDAQSTPMSKADLNNPSGGYPNAKRGFQVVCKQIDTIYIKVDDNTNDWQPITTGGNVL